MHKITNVSLIWHIFNALCSISHHSGPDIQIPAGVKASRPSHTDVLLIDGCVLMPLRAFLRHDFRLPSQNNRLSNACEIYKSETMGGLLNDYSSALYEGMQNLPLNKKSYSSSLLAILEKPAPSCRSEGNQMMLY